MTAPPLPPMAHLERRSVLGGRFRGKETERLASIFWQIRGWYSISAQLESELSSGNTESKSLAAAPNIILKQL